MRTAIPSAVYVLRWGADGQQSVNALQSMGRERDGAGDLDGLIPNVESTLRIILSECGDWTPPADGDSIHLTNSAGAEVGTFTALSHRDDPTGAVRTLVYGEASA